MKIVEAMIYDFWLPAPVYYALPRLSLVAGVGAGATATSFEAAVLSTVAILYGVYTLLRRSSY